MKLHGKGLRIFCINTNTTSGQIIPKNTDRSACLIIFIIRPDSRLIFARIYQRKSLWQPANRELRHSMRLMGWIDLFWLQPDFCPIIEHLYDEIQRSYTEIL